MMPKPLARIPVRRALALAGFARAALFLGTPQAQDYPSRPVKVVVPFSPGGAVDGPMRVIAQELSKRLGQQVIVENKPGAGATIGSDLVAKAAPDGYTLLLASQNVPVTRRYLSKNRPVDPNVALTPIAALWRTTLVIVSHPSFPSKTLQQLIAYAKANPDKVSYGSSGVGTQAHFAGANFATIAGIGLLHVPYNNNRQLADLLAGDVPTTIIIVSSVLQHVRSGRVRALAVAGHKRLPI
jgi:tripartite-type tricarboxylate transporter receptor subunit TctC